MLLSFWKSAQEMLVKSNQLLGRGGPIDCWFQLVGRITGTFPDAQLDGPTLVASPLCSGIEEGPSKAHGKVG